MRHKKRRASGRTTCVSEETPLRESNPPSEMHARHLLIAAMAAALCLASAATAQNDMSFNDLPKTEDLMTEIFGVLGGSLQEQHDVSEDEVKRHLASRRDAPRAIRPRAATGIRSQVSPALNW